MTSVLELYNNNIINNKQTNKKQEEKLPVAVQNNITSII